VTLFGPLLFPDAAERLMPVGMAPLLPNEDDSLPVLPLRDELTWVTYIDLLEVSGLLERVSMTYVHGVPFDLQ
jgi:hypothetical protein